MLVSCSWGGVPASSRPPPGGWRYTPGSSCTRGHSTLLVIHRRKKKEEKENVVAAGWRDELECRTSKNDLKKKRFRENIHFGRVVVWYGVSRMIINFSTHPFRQVFFYSSVSSKIILVHNSQCGKESNQFHPPKQEQGSLPCLSSLSFLPCYKCFFTFHF